MKKYALRISAFISALLIVVFDQLTKYLAVKYVMPTSKIEIIKGVLNFTYVENPGAVGGIFAGAPWVFNVVTVVAVAVLCVALIMGKFNQSKLLTFSVSFIIGGGIGNMIDRLFRVADNGVHYVVDFIDVIFIPVWTLVFNVADCFVVIGCGLIILYCIIEAVAEFKNKKDTE